MGGTLENPNVFDRSTGVRCPGAHCEKGMIMHRRTWETVPYDIHTVVIGAKLPMHYVDHYYCSEGCGIACVKPGKYTPPPITDWDPIIEELKRKLKSHPPKSR